MRAVRRRRPVISRHRAGRPGRTGDETADGRQFPMERPPAGTERNVRYTAVRPKRADRTGRNTRPVTNLPGLRYGRYAFFTVSPRGSCSTPNYTTLDDLESAISRSDHRAFTEALASSTGWDYDSANRVLSFTSSCSQRIVARYVLPESFGDTAVAVASERLDRRAIAERVTQSAAANDKTPSAPPYGQ